VNDRKHMDITEFRESGLLQEINRRLLHPLGLALEVSRDADGNETLGGIWDARDDPQGILFDVASDSDGFFERAAAVQTAWGNRRGERVAYMGSMVQSIGPHVDGPLQ
jgi:hypothetical protein